VIIINSASFGFTLTKRGVTPAREINPFPEVYFSVVARITTPPATPARAMRPEQRI
jgi:hypothetical protein